MKRLCHNTWEREERRLGWEQEEEEEEEEGDRGGKRRPVGGWESYLFTLHFTTVHVQTPERICRARSRLRRCNVSVIRVQPLEEPERWGGNSGVTGRRAREGGEKKRCGGEKKKNGSLLCEALTKSRPLFTSTAEAQCSSKVGEIEVKCGAEVFIRLWLWSKIPLTAPLKRRRQAARSTKKDGEHSIFF